MKIRMPVLFLMLGVIPAFAQQLPTGTYRPNRERNYDIVHYKAALKIDWKAKQVSGEAVVTLRPLVSASAIVLDAYWLKVSAVKNAANGSDLRYTSNDASLTIDLGRNLRSTDTVAVAIRYSATPTAGMYFIEPGPGTNNQPAIFTYGEGGIHANWLPIYNDNNDKFSTEMIVTVNKPHTVISNGSLLSTKDNSDGTRTFHWYQSLPHSNYLIALFVGEYNGVPLRTAFGSIPLTAWVHPGQEQQAAEVFARTPDMVEFFSNRFSFRFPWDKYDQISAFDYAIGAMENTGITGHNDRILRGLGQTEEFNPDYENYATNWTSEALISHELAHHWFGNNTTCTNLANIWINESFASYMMMLWDEHRLGNEALQVHTWLALQSYLKYVATSHVIRPLEYRYFDTRGQIYNSETTYQKGALVLHMMRWVLGDDTFFQGLGYFQNKHKFSNVESEDLKTAIGESTGRNLQWFFEQWMWGGGHPVFEVSTNYVADRKKVEVTIDQVQAQVDGQGIFNLPVDIRIDAGGTSQRKTVWVYEQNETFLFDAAAAPEMISVDGQGALVAEVRHSKSLAELIYQMKNDDLPGRLWAVQQLTAQYSSDPSVVAAIRFLVESKAPWVLKAEATLQLRTILYDDAQSILLAQLNEKDHRIRKAAVIALGSRYTDAARAALKRVIEIEQNDDVASTALVSLAKIDGSLSLDAITKFSETSSWYDCKRIAGLKAMEILAATHLVPQRSRFVTHVKNFANVRYNYAVRQQALKTWAACNPQDQMLAERLTSFAQNDILPVRITSIELLAKLNIVKALPTLEDVVRRNGDDDIRHAAQAAIDAIRGMSGKQE
ncbi:MAG: M1 family metallopeptidase [Bacteroidota bacterium]